MRRLSFLVLAIPALAACIACNAQPEPLPNGLLLALATFEKGPPGPVPQPATLGILSGAIWAQTAWGRYWGWDPKETWTLVTWLWFLLILHLCPLSRWRGRRLAVLVLAGFALVCFTFVGVPWLVRTVRLETLHGF